MGLRMRSTGSLLLAAAEGDSDLKTALSETVSVQDAVTQDLQQLKPNVILETVKSWLPGLLGFGYNLLIAVAIVVIGYRVVKLVRGICSRTFTRMGLDLNVANLLSNVIDAILYAVILFMAAERIGIPSASIIALLGSAGIAVGLSLQGSLSNVAGSLLILVMRPFKVGDYITGAGVEGTVQNIGIVYTTLLTVDNKRVIVPNGTLSGNTIVNVSAEEKRRVDVKVGVSYQTDLAMAKAVMERVCRSCDKILPDDGVTVYVNSLDASAVTLGAFGWVRTADYFAALWWLQEQVKLAFDAEGIEIPYDQMDVNIRSLPAAAAVRGFREQ